MGKPVGQISFRACFTFQSWEAVTDTLTVKRELSDVLVSHSARLKELEEQDRPVLIRGRTPGNPGVWCVKG